MHSSFSAGFFTLSFSSALVLATAAKQFHEESLLLEALLFLYAKPLPTHAALKEHAFEMVGSLWERVETSEVANGRASDG